MVKQHNKAIPSWQNKRNNQPSSSISRSMKIAVTALICFRLSASLNLVGNTSCATKTVAPSTSTRRSATRIVTPPAQPSRFAKIKNFKPSRSWTTIRFAASNKAGGIAP